MQWWEIVRIFRSSIRSNRGHKESNKERERERKNLRKREREKERERERNLLEEGK